MPSDDDDDDDDDGDDAADSAHDICVHCGTVICYCVFVSTHM